MNPSKCLIQQYFGYLKSFAHIIMHHDFYHLLAFTLDVEQDNYYLIEYIYYERDIKTIYPYWDWFTGRQM